MLHYEGQIEFFTTKRTWTGCFLDTIRQLRNSLPNLDLPSIQYGLTSSNIKNNSDNCVIYFSSFLTSGIKVFENDTFSVYRVFLLLFLQCQ